MDTSRESRPPDVQIDETKRDRCTRVIAREIKLTRDRSRGLRAEIKDDERVYLAKRNDLAKRKRKATLSLSLFIQIHFSLLLLRTSFASEKIRSLKCK